MPLHVTAMYVGPPAIRAMLAKRAAYVGCAECAVCAMCALYPACAVWCALLIALPIMRSVSFCPVGRRTCYVVSTILP